MIIIKLLHAEATRGNMKKVVNGEYMDLMLDFIEDPDTGKMIRGELNDDQM